MRFYLLIFFFLLLSCNKPKTVLICGDHICINKLEAEQYFEENLSLEVKIIGKKEKKEIDLIELNLSENSTGKREVKLSSIDKTNKNIKILSQEEIIKIKKKIKNKKNEKEIVEKQKVKKDKNNKEIVKKITKENKKIDKKKNKKTQQTSEPIKTDNVNKNYKDVVDVCTIIEKCSIDEISKYLLKQGKNKSFPDITKRQ